MADFAMFHAALPLAMVTAAVAVCLLPGRVPAHRAGRSHVALSPSMRRNFLTAAGTVAALLLVGAPWWLMALAAPAACYGSVRVSRRDRPLPLGEMRAVAATLDIFAACLDSGLTTTAALSACVSDASERLGRGHEALAEVSALLLLGGNPSEAWGPAARVPALAELAAAAQRSSLGGLRLAGAARESADALRTACRVAVTDRAARAGVTMTAPLAVCFLPAFLCLGLAPTVIGMVTSIRLW